MSKHLITLCDEDIFPENMLASKPESLIELERVKGIVFDEEGKLALVCTTRSKLLPGGGVEKGENLFEAMERECLEEMGCRVRIKKEIGFSDEYRVRNLIRKPSRQIIHCFVGHIVGKKGKPQTTQDDELGMKVEWHTLDSAITILEEQIGTISLESYHLCFNVRAQLVFLNEYKQHHV